MEISFSNFSISAAATAPTNNEPTNTPTPPRQNGSLIRPERIRIDAQHPQYHTRKKLTNEDYYRPAGERSTLARRSVIRRGLLRREDEDDEKHQQSNDQTENIKDAADKIASSFSIWTAFCYTVTCCCPPPILKAMGKLHQYTNYACINSICFFFVCRQKR